MNDTTAPGQEVASQTRRRRTIVAAVIGNALEWYDFVVYALLAGAIAKLFFPAGEETVSLLLALATFGVGFVMRPMGAIVIGIFTTGWAASRRFSLRSCRWD